MGKIVNFVIIAMIVLTFLIVVGGLSLNSNQGNMTFERITKFINGYNKEAISLDVSTVTPPNITGDWGAFNFVKTGINMIINGFTDIVKVLSLVASGIWNALQFLLSILEGI